MKRSCDSSVDWKRAAQRGRSGGSGKGGGDGDKQPAVVQDPSMGFKIERVVGVEFKKKRKTERMSNRDRQRFRKFKRGHIDSRKNKHRDNQEQGPSSGPGSGGTQNWTGEAAMPRVWDVQPVNWQQQSFGGFGYPNSNLATFRFNGGGATTSGLPEAIWGQGNTGAGESTAHQLHWEYPNPIHDWNWSAPVASTVETIEERAFRLLLVTPSAMSVSQFTVLPLSLQLDMLFSSQILSKPEVQTRVEIIQQMIPKVQRHYPQYRLIPFGTFAEGLAGASTFIDVYVDLLGFRQGPNAGQLKIPRNQVSRTARENVFALFRGDPEWTNLQVLQHHGQLIRMTHCQSNITFDLQFVYSKEVDLSNLLELYMKLDPRIRPFFAVLRIWTRWMFFNGLKYVWKYALSLMGLVVLMEMGVVPNVEQLKIWNRGRSGIYLDNVEEIRRNFAGKGKEYPEELSEFVVAAMLKFWSKYGHLDFDKFVISALAGTTTKVDWRVKQWDQGGNLVCVEDPLRPSCNVANLKDPLVLRKFQNICKKSAERVGEVKVDSVLQLFVAVEKEEAKEDKKATSQEEGKKSGRRMKSGWGGSGGGEWKRGRFQDAKSDEKPTKTMDL